MIGENLIKTILLAFILAAIAHITARWRQGEIRVLQWLAWIMVWLVGAVMVLFPELSTGAARMVGVGRGADLMMYFSVVTLFYIAFRTLVRIELLNRNLTEVVRTLAIELREREDRLQENTSRGTNERDQGSSVESGGSAS